MHITDLNVDDRVFTRLDSDPAPPIPSPYGDVVKAMLDGFKAKVKPAAIFPFAREVAYQEPRKAEEFVLKPGDGPGAFRAWLAEQSVVQTEWGPIQLRPYGTGYWVPIEELTQAVIDRVTTKLSADSDRADTFAINEAFRRHCPEPLRCVDVRDAVNQLRNKGQTITHIIASDGVEVPDDLHLIVHRFPVADGFVLTGASESPILLTRETGFEFLTNVVGGNTGDRASFAIERKVGVSVIGPLELCRVVPAA